MKIIITNYFEKIFEKECKDIDLDFLIKKININSKGFIQFKEPFFKVKINSKTKTYRLIINFEKDFFNMICINIFDKKNKNIWENINWNLHNDLILKYYELNLDDIEKWKYKVYEI